MKKEQETNYLDKIPSINLKSWKEDTDGNVILHIDNKGIVVAVVAWLFKRSRITNIPLDENSSTAWKLIDGNKSIKGIADVMDQKLGERVAPVYERLSLLIKYLAGQGWITLR